MAEFETADLWRSSMRRDMRDLAHSMQTLTTTVQAMQSDVRDINIFLLKGIALTC
jgi:hypothetical protein